MIAEKAWKLSQSSDTKGTNMVLDWGKSVKPDQGPLVGKIIQDMMVKEVK